jgi:stalled ribosome rescue protein Dom34
MRELASASDARVLMAEQLWEDSPPHEIAEAAWALLRSVHLQREQERAELAVDRALGGHAGAVGLRHVCEAINAGRVSHLLYDDQLELEGFVSEEGTLHPRVEGVIAQSDLELRREPWFVERLLETAIRTSAAVVPLNEDAAALLGEHEGVAALLRW